MFRQLVSSLRFNILGIQSKSGSVTKLIQYLYGGGGGRYAEISESLSLSRIYKIFKVKMVMMWVIVCVCVCLCVYVCVCVPWQHRSSHSPYYVTFVSFTEYKSGTTPQKLPFRVDLRIELKNTNATSESTCTHVNPFRSYIGPRPTVLFLSSVQMSEDVRQGFRCVCSPAVGACPFMCTAV
jgi:hypothetical protein